MTDVINEIKNKISIEDLVSQYVQLKKTGRNLKGLCPFHNEKTPSFVVSPEKQICHCFGCNKGGDIFGFIQEIEGVNFPEAISVLAEKCGVKVEKTQFVKKEGKDEKDPYFKAHNLACDFFEKQLWETKEGEKVLKYLYERGLKDEIIKEFRLGFAPDDYQALYPLLLKNKIPVNVLLKSGLASSKTVSSDNIYDKFRLRLIFPIFDYMGRICGFGGRALKKDQMPKYLNSADNLIYNKSKIMYGLYNAKQFIKKEDKVVLVEGYFDVLLPYQSGVKNVVATSGKALTNNHITFLNRLTSNIVTCFDNDKAGEEANKKAYFLFQSKGINVKTVDILKGKDPADFVQQGGDFSEAVDKAPSFIDHFLNILLKSENLSTLEGRKKIINEFSYFYKNMSATEKEFYLGNLSMHLNINQRNLYEEMENYRTPDEDFSRLGDEENLDMKVDKLTTEERIIGLLLEYPNLFKIIESKLDENLFENKDMKEVYKVLANQYNSFRDKFENWNKEKGFLFEIKEKLDILLLYISELYQDFSIENLEIEINKLLDRGLKEKHSRTMKDLYNLLTKAEETGDKEQSEKVMKQLQDLHNQILNYGKN